MDINFAVCMYVCMYGYSLLENKAINFIGNTHCVCSPTMSTKLFVGRLTEGTSSDEILSLFRKYGTVTECTVLGNYGFVVSIFMIIWCLVDQFIVVVFFEQILARAECRPVFCLSDT